MNSVALFIALLSTAATPSLSRGVFSIELVRYANPSGFREFENNVLCCDSFPRPSDGKCVDPCDTRVDICLDHANSTSTDIRQCPLGSATTGQVFQDRNSFDFPKPFAGFASNPILFQFNTWEGALRVKIRVSDVDASRLKTIDRFLILHQNAFLLQKQRTRMPKIPLLGERRLQKTRLTVAMAGYCDFGFYGPACSRRCFPQNDCDAHYSCDEVTGRRRCLAGWTGKRCNVKVPGINDCPRDSCRNNGTCVFVGPQPNDFFCCCRQGFTGLNCSQTVGQCTGQPCENGGQCLPSSDRSAFRCRCPGEFYGTRCEHSVLDQTCDDKPCLNGASCQDLQDFNSGFRCVCPASYEGTACERRVCTGLFC